MSRLLEEHAGGPVQPDVRRRLMEATGPPAEFLHRLGRTEEAATAYAEALHLTDNPVEREFLSTRLDQLRR